MAPSRTDQFLDNLKRLMDTYPEYSRILQLLIEQVQQGNAVKIQAKLQQLQSEDW